MEGKIYDTWLCASKDLKKAGETKSALDNYYQINRMDNETHYEFCMNNSWKKYIDTMIVVDYLILIGSRSVYDNLGLIEDKKNFFKGG